MRRLRDCTNVMHVETTQDREYKQPSETEQVDYVDIAIVDNKYKVDTAVRIIKENVWDNANPGVLGKRGSVHTV